MRFEVNLTLEVDEDSGILGSDRAAFNEDVLDYLLSFLYDLDDVVVLESDVAQLKE